jgi:hypothetical protein
MAGTLHGLVNRRCNRISSADYHNWRNYFAAVADFFDHLSTPAGGNYMTRIASKFGVGGSGLSHTLSATPIGTENAFGLWRLNTSARRPGGGTALGAVYFFVWSTSNNDPNTYTPSFYVAGANSSTADVSVGMAVAWREDGGSPWNVGGGATELDNGSDTWGNPIWVDGGSYLHIIPRTNNPGGTHATPKSNLINFPAMDCYNHATQFGHFHGIADADNIAMVMTNRDGMAVDPKRLAFFFWGVGDLHPNIAADPYFCYCIHEHDLPISENSNYSDSSAYNGNNGFLWRPGMAGGTPVGASLQTTPSLIQFESALTGLDAARQPNPYSSGQTDFDEAGVQLKADDAWVGWGHEPGEDDFWRLTYLVPSESLDAVNQRAAFGSPNTNEVRVTLPWPSSIGEAPGATRTVDGVTF